LNRFTPTWIVEHFFSETLNLSYDTFVRVVKERWRGSAPPPFSELETLIRKVRVLQAMKILILTCFGTGRSWTYQRPPSESTPTPKVVHEITAGLAFVIRLTPEHYLTPYSSCEPNSYLLRNAAYYSYLYCRLIVPLILFRAFQTLHYYGDSPLFVR
jgi:hypothetical protein